MTLLFAEIGAEIDRRGLRPATCRGIFVGGSLARGWEHAKSDADTYVIVTEPWSGPDDGRTAVKLDPPTVPVRVFYLGTLRCELRYWLDAQVDQMLAKVSWPEFEGGFYGESLSVAETMFLGRLGHAVALDGGEWLATRREQVGNSAYRAMEVTRFLGMADGHVEDAVGLLESGDHPAAVIAAQLALDLTVEALLASRGDLAYSFKWRVRRLREANLALLPADRYREIATFRSFDPDNPRAWIESVLQLCRRICLEIEI
jgi:HEPN domain-containing protein